MCIMEKYRKRKLNSEPLSNSYCKGIGRVVGVNAHETYEIPPETIKQRQAFWDDLFLDYSEQFSDDEYDLKTLKLCSSKCKSTAVDKHIRIVQYWVDTGYLPYQMSIHKIGHLAKDHVSIERELNMKENIERDLNITMCYTKAHCNENSLSSSVDTAAYILSNINTTNKADTMAIVEGAKHDDLENVVDTTHCESIEISKIADDVMHDNNGENDTRDNNNSNSCQHSSVTTEIITCTMPQENIDTQEDVDMLDEALNMKSPSIDSCKSYSCKLSNIVSTPEHSKESYLRKSLLDCSAIKIKHRKKLYRGRDSPVDLITMKRSHKEVLCKLTSHIHPALNFKYPLQKKRNIRKRTSFKRWMVNKSLMNSTLSASDSKKSDEIENIKNYSNRLSLKLRDLKKLDDAPCTNHEILNNSNNIQDLNKCNKNQSINVSSPSQSVSQNHEEDSQNNELNDTIIRSEKINTIASDTLSNFKQSTNSTDSTNLVIQTVDSQKHKKKSDKIMNDFKILNPVIALPRLSDLDIQKYKKLKNHSHNLHPVVCLKRLSESEIQKYKRSANTMKDAKYLNAIVRLKRLSEVTAKRYKTALNMKTRSKTDLLSDTVKLSDSKMNKSQLSLRNKANTKTRSKSDLFPNTVKLSDSNMNESQFSLRNKANTRSKSDSLPDTVKLSDSNMNKSQFSLRNKANMKTRSKSDLFPDTVKLADSNMNKSRLSLRNKANTKTRSKTDLLSDAVKLSESNMNKSRFSLRNKANTKTRSKTDLLSDTVKLSDSNMNKSQLSLGNKANTKTHSETDLLSDTVKLSDSNMNKSQLSLGNKANTNTHGKTDLLFDVVKLSDSSMNKPQLSLTNEADGLKSPLNIINVESCDTDSNESTILIYKCSSKVSDDISVSNVLGPPKMLAEFSSPGVKTCRNSNRLKLSEIKKNFTLRKDTTSRQSIDNALNTSTNSQKHIFNTSSPCESETFKNGYSDNVHTTIDKKMKLHLDSLVNPKRRLRNREKFNVTKEQNGNGRNNLTERGICNTIGKRKSEEQTVVKNLIEAADNGKIKKSKNKFNTNHFHFETKLFDSDSELTSDSEFFS